MTKEKLTQATVFQRLEVICGAVSRPVPPVELRVAIGKEIAQKYFEQANVPKYPLNRKTQLEDGGEFSVLIYPGFFIPVMDSIIRREVMKLPRVRKRIPVKKKPAYVSKKNFFKR